MRLLNLKSSKKKLPLNDNSFELRKTLSTGDIEDDHILIIKKPSNNGQNIKGILRTAEKSQQFVAPALSFVPIIEQNKPNEDELSSQLNVITASNLELLLSLETQTRMDFQARINERPSRIRFNFPPPTPRSKSLEMIPTKRSWPEEDQKKVQSSRWNRFINRQQQKEEERLPNLDSSYTIGSKVKLYKRPLPIIGTIKFIGSVHFDSGEWLGLELNSRVGNTDGEMDGIRYFQTNSHCGIFVKKEDTIKI